MDEMVVDKFAFKLRRVRSNGRYFFTTMYGRKFYLRKRRNLVPREGLNVGMKVRFSWTINVWGSDKYEEFFNRKEWSTLGEIKEMLKLLEPYQEKYYDPTIEKPIL